MNDEQFKQKLESVVEKIVSKQLDSILRKLQSVISVGTVAEIDYTGRTAKVDLLSGGQTGSVQYPSNYSSAEIGVGQRVLVVTTDPNNNNAKFIVAAVGRF